MKALVLEKYNELAYKDVPDPEIGDDEVLVKIKACGICGSDIHGIDGSSGRRIPPMIMGHEASGVIVQKGRLVKDWQTGDRVTFDSTVYPLNDWYTLNGHYNLSDNREVLGVSPGSYKRDGAFAEYVAIPQHILYKIPDNVGFEQAAMVELIAVALHSIRISKLQPAESCVVVGVGMVGIQLIKLLRLFSTSKIIAIDVKEENLQNASDLGADACFLPSDENLTQKILDLTKGRGADLAFEAVGKSETVNVAINTIRKGGRLVLIGNTDPAVDLPLQKIVTWELTLHGSCAINGEYEAVLDLLSEGKISVDDQISAVAPLSEGASWFRRLRDNKEGLKKVILNPEA